MQLCFRPVSGLVQTLNFTPSNSPLLVSRCTLRGQIGCLLKRSCHSVCGLLSVSPHALCLTSHSVLSQSPLSPQTPLLLLLFFFCCNRRASRAGGLPHTESLQRGTPCAACKSPLSYMHTHTWGSCVCLPGSSEGSH